MNNLEKKVANLIKESYSKWDYVRCYNLMKLMYKINKSNPTFLRYVTKLDNKKIKKYKNNWALGGSSWFIDLLKSPKLYLSFFLLYFLWRIK
jgi:hypothetical protein